MHRIGTSTALFFLIASASISAQYTILYSPNEHTQQPDLTRHLTRDHDRILAASESSDGTLIITSYQPLSAGDILALTERLVDYYEINEDSKDVSSIPLIRFLWDRVSDPNDENEENYNRGATVSSPLLESLAKKRSMSSILSATSANIRTIVPSDPYDIVDQARDGATESFDTDHTLHGDDIDWFKFAVDRAGLYQVQTHPVSEQSTVDTVIELFKMDEKQAKLVNDDGGEGVYSRLVFDAEPNVSYKVKVRSFGSSSGYYRITLGPADSDFFAEDQYEPNDSRDAATEIQYDTIIEASIHRGDVDWFDVRGMQTGRVYLVLLSSEGSEMSATAFVGDEEDPRIDLRRFYRFYLSSNGPYYIRINGMVGQYTVLITDDDVEAL